jgi:hypothetical protein
MFFIYGIGFNVSKSYGQVVEKKIKITQILYVRDK